ncbi:MAG: CopG family transcriptional regulator [Peptostreptococcaceae bacterium]|nr:CopG family transcriptional regulator [Peptostreptococcaceae bacterium]
MGRPIKNDNPRILKMTIMLSQEEKDDIQYCADKLQVSRTDAIIKGIRNLKKDI